jgi:hypothetical protein
MSIRCTNKDIEAIKYFKAHNINYYDNELFNNDRTIMNAWTSYVMHFYNEAIYEYNAYVANTDKIAYKVIHKPIYKLFMQGNPIAKKILIHKKFYKDLYLKEQVHARRFHELGNIIADLDPEKDIEDAVIYHINNLMPKINEKIYYKNLNEENNEIAKYKIFAQYIMNMMNSLKKLGKTDRLKEIADLHKQLMESDYNEKQKQKKLSK